MSRTARGGFVERTIASLLRASEYAGNAERLAASRGLLQRVDARIKLVGLLLLIVAVVASRRLSIVALLLLLAACMAGLSRIRFTRLAGWVWLPVLFFTGTIAAPAAFFTAGRPLAQLGPLVLTDNGLRSAAFLLLRAETAATLSALLVLTTSWPAVLKALHVLRCPVVLVAVLGMTYRYIFLILQTAEEMMESRRSRTVGRLAGPDSRRLAAAAVGVLLNKSLQLSGDVHLAMQARGYRGELYLLDEPSIRSADWIWLAALSAVAAAALWYGR